MSKTYTIIHGQCNRAMKAKIEDDANWEFIDKNCDPIGLLSIIKAVAHNNETQRNPTVSLILAQKWLMNMIQADGQSNDSYHLKFENQADVIENMGGLPYGESTLDIASQKLFQLDYEDVTDTDDQVTVQEAATELWKAMLLITNSNQKKFDQLKKELHNNYISGDKNIYPTTFMEAYSHLNRYKPFTSYDEVIEPSAGQSYHQHGNESDSDNSHGSNKPVPQKYKTWTCQVCGEKGHPPSANYCKLVKGIKDNESLHNKIKAELVSANEHKKKDKKNRADKKKDKHNKKNKDKERKEKEKQEIIKEVLATLEEQGSSYSSQSDQDSGSESSDDEDNHGFTQFTFAQRNQNYSDDQSISTTSSKSSNKPDNDPTNQPPNESRSAKKTSHQPSSDAATWTLVKKKSRIPRGLPKTTLEFGDEVVMKNNLTGMKRQFKCGDLCNNQFSAFAM